MWEMNWIVGFYVGELRVGELVVGVDEICIIGVRCVVGENVVERVR